MPRYRRAQVPGGLYFFTVSLADRKSAVLLDRIDHFRTAYQKTKIALPFETIAIRVLPDHLHALWRLPVEDRDFSIRWRRIKTTFSGAMPMQARRSSSKRRKRGEVSGSDGSGSL